MGTSNYTYLTGSLWGLNVKCSWQKALNQTNCTNARWGNWWSGKLSDLLKVTWLVNARIPQLVFPLHLKGLRVFQWQHTIYPLHHIPSWRCLFIPIRLLQKGLSWSHTIKASHPSSVKAHNASLKAWDGIPLSAMSAAQALLWAHSDKELRWRHRWTGSQRGVQGDGGSARSMELWVRHMRRIMKISSVQRQTQRTHDTDNTATLPSVAPLPFLSGISNPVPPDGYRETSVGTGQLLAVSSVISYICPSIGCRCQFRPNRCMAVVSNEKSHLFLPEVEMELPSHRGGWVGWGTQGFSSAQLNK